jgi:hypothetical protein
MGTAGGHGRGVRTGSVRFHRGHRFFNDYGYWPYFYPDYDSKSETVEGPPPLIIVVQPAQATSPAVVPSPSESLMLELQGDHWVRITNHGQPQIGEEPDQAESERTSKLASGAPPLPSAGLRQLNPQASFHLPYLCFATGTRKK